MFRMAQQHVMHGGVRLGGNKRWHRRACMQTSNSDRSHGDGGSSSAADGRPQPRKSKFPTPGVGASKSGSGSRKEEYDDSAVFEEARSSSRFRKSVLPADYGEQYSQEASPSPFSSPVRTPFADDNSSASSDKSSVEAPLPSDLPSASQQDDVNNPGLGLRIELPPLPNAGQLVIVASFALVILSMLVVFALTVRSGAISLNAE